MKCESLGGILGAPWLECEREYGHVGLHSRGQIPWERDSKDEAATACVRVADTMIGVFNDSLSKGCDAITAMIEMNIVGKRLAIATGLAFLSGAEHELEFYGGDR